MSRLLISTLIILICSFSSSAQPENYKLFNSKGKLASYDEMIRSANSADVIFFGELHDNPIAHWLEIELLKKMIDLRSGKVMTGAEMFEADDQIVIDEYLSGKISEKSFTTETKIWSNYKTDYRPLVELCKSKSIPFIATNVPRRYASLVYTKGIAALDSLSSTAKSYLAPLPYPYDSELKCYKEISSSGHGGVNLPMSQALKDATMAYFISKNFRKDHTFIHYNGAYHSNYHEGIVWYLKKYQPSLKSMTIAVVEQDQLNKLDQDNLDLADFIIVVDSDMTKTQQ
jgi:uncharacterized iron-regulated protein